ncbi:MAG: aldehyde ferredoxin oxidoreductase family protein [Pelolinea sp.]|nr:aldehyde ferredoxin oxidoreductase family protein [Pelolinea sp.]
MANGFHGKIIHVNLTTSDIQIEQPEDLFYRKYMGGSAMGTYYLLKNTPAGVDPLGPENTFCLFPSVITGASISGLSRITATAKSPISGLIGDSQAGGFFPAEFKKTGFDGLVVTGKAENFVYIWIHDGEIDIRDARHLVGKYTADVEDLIRSELGDDRIQIAQCGIAAENGILYSSIISNSNRAHGRTGMGAVMASKNLKAVVVRGKTNIKLYNVGRFREIAKSGAMAFPDSGVFNLGKYGTAATVEVKNTSGYLPSKNWSSGFIEGIEQISGKVMYDTVLKDRDTCFACVVRCKRVVEITEGKYHVNPRYGGPEYETLSTLGSYCGVKDLAAICYANQLCNMYGVDTIACGATIAWAMDCYEKGYLNLSDTNNIDLHFGNADAMVAMVEAICKREGLGITLGLGSVRAAEILGVGQELVVAVKGSEVPAHMPHDRIGLGLIYSVNPFGADHESSEHDPFYTFASDDYSSLGLLNPQPYDAMNFEKIKFSLYTQYLVSVNDTLCVCNFVYGPVWHLYKSNDLVEIINVITGWNVSLWELMLIGKRRLNLMRAFNAREGVGREADTFPEKMSKPLSGGPTDGIFIPREKILDAQDQYYEMAGWDKEGKPTRSTLEELGLGWLANELNL